MKTTLLELIGFAGIGYGFWLAWPPLGFIVGGVLLALVAYLVDRGAE
jgi:hypothetical protein